MLGRRLIMFSERTDRGFDIARERRIENLFVLPRRVPFQYFLRSKF